MAVVRVGLPVERLADQTLLDGLRTGDDEISVGFVRRFQTHVYGVALAVVGDPSIAEEVAQQTFERVWRRASSFDPDRGTVKAWMTTITRNLAVDAVRVRKPQPVDPTDLIRLLGPATTEPETSSMHNETRAELRSALRLLPPDQARAVVMAGVYRMTAQEVADSEGIPLGTAKTRIRAAMIKLKHHLVSGEVTNE
jgi:RNA polymerase sigma factor (sigma-70 family)